MLLWGDRKFRNMRLPLANDRFRDAGIAFFCIIGSGGDDGDSLAALISMPIPAGEFLKKKIPSNYFPNKE